MSVSPQIPNPWVVYLNQQDNRSLASFVITDPSPAITFMGWSQLEPDQSATEEWLAIDTSPPNPTLYLFPAALTSVGDYRIILKASEWFTDVTKDVALTIKIVCAQTLSITPPEAMTVIHDLNKTNY